jgi:addiction module HigA family antidote
MLDKYNLNPFKLSKEIHLSQSAVRLIVIGKTRISVPVALRLAKYFSTTPEYWLQLQMRYDLLEAAKDKKLDAIIRSIPKVKKGGTAAKAPAKARAGRKASGKKTPAKRGRKPAGAKKPVRGKAKARAGRPRKAR